MLTIISKQQNPNITSYFDSNIIRVKADIASILVFDNTYIEPFVYIDGGIYDSAGTPVDAGYYNTALWAITYNGGYA